MGDQTVVSIVRRPACTFAPASVERLAPCTTGAGTSPVTRARLRIWRWEQSGDGLRDGRSLADAILNSFGADREDILGDPSSRAMSWVWWSDPRYFERAFSGVAQAA
jgi:hypothetical protein